MRRDQAITRYQRFQKEEGGRTHITKCQISKERLEGIDKRCLGNKWGNLEKIPVTSSRILVLGHM